MCHTSVLVPSCFGSVSCSQASAGSGRRWRRYGASIDVPGRTSSQGLLQLGAKPLRREGKGQGRWVLIDFGDVVVHVQHAEDRVYYALERLWKDCPVIELPADARGVDELEQAGREPEDRGE